MGYIISGIQQIGIGTPDVERSWRWYRRYFGMDVPVFQEAAEAPFMTRYTGDKVQSRTATLALNLNGGGGFEIWQYTSRESAPPKFDAEMGDLGIFVTKMKTRNVQKAHQQMSGSLASKMSPLYVGPKGKTHFFVKDEGGNWFQVSESDQWFSKKGENMGGPKGAIIGVSDIDAALKLYSNILGYDKVVYDETDVFTDFTSMPGGNREMRRVLLTHSEPRKGPFSKLLGKSEIELVQLTHDKGRKIFADRFWGDQGYIHLCFDIRGMSDLRSACEKAGFPFTVDSNDTFDMGEAAGHFSYVEDPDGTLIEFVEAHRMPIMKKIGWYLDLSSRDPEKSLPDFMLKALAFARVKD